MARGTIVRIAVGVAVMAAGFLAATRTLFGGFLLYLLGMYIINGSERRD